MTHTRNPLFVAVLSGLLVLAGPSEAQSSAPDTSNTASPNTSDPTTGSSSTPAQTTPQPQAPAATATSPALLPLVTPLTLEQQAKKADVIVRATIGNGSLLPDGGVNYLAYPLTIVESIFGDANTLPQQDGKPTLFVLQGLKEAPTLASGQEAILLLYKQKLDSPFVGVNQGFYLIQNGKVSAGNISAPNELRDAIRKARDGGQL